MTTERIDDDQSPRTQFALAAEQFEQRIALRHDLEILRHTERWPHGCLLCLRHRTKKESGGITRVGLIWAKYPRAVLRINMFDLPMFGGSVTIEEALATRVDYASHAALLQDWEID